MKTTARTRLIPCRVPGCPHKPFNKAQGEATHYHRVHSGNIRVPNQRRFRPPELKNGNGNTAKSVELPARKIDRRLKSWRDANPDLAKPRGHRKNGKHRPHAHRPKTTEVLLNFCPRCALDLHAVAVGMAMALAATNRK